MTGKNTQSMQEIMLEFIVMNYKEVFGSLLEGSCTNRKKMLPPSLFEKIIYKSKEMKWCINSMDMQNFMTFRDVLSWKSINLELFTANTMNGSILERMSRVEYPLKTLSIYMDDLSNEIMNALCLMGSTIECLELKYQYRILKTEILNGYFPNLKKLSFRRINGYGEWGDKLCIDLSRFSETLEELKLENVHLDDRLIRSIACLKKLKVLSLPFSSADYSYFCESLHAMIYLRTLDLRYFKEKCGPSHYQTSKLLSVISEMPNLENFDTSLQTFTNKDILEFVKCRKWKRFGFYDIYASDFQRSYDKFKLLADEVFGFFEETMLSTFEIYGQEQHPTAIYKNIYYLQRFVQFLPFVPQDQLMRVENIILNTFADNDCHSKEVLEYIETGRCTDDFITKLINIITSYCCNFRTSIVHYYCFDKDSKDIVTSAPVARKMLEIMEKNLNKGLCRKLSKVLFICSYEKLSRQIEELGLASVFEKAIERNVLDHDALVALKTLYKKIN